MPDCLELTFVNRRGYRFARSCDSFPGPLDAANNPTLPDLHLGLFKAADFRIKKGPAKASSIFELLAERATRSAQGVLELPAYLLVAAQEELASLATAQPRAAYCLAIHGAHVHFPIDATTPTGAATAHRGARL